MKNLKTFESFLNEQEVAKAAPIELPKQVLYNKTSKEIKKGNFYVNIDENSVTIQYDRSNFSSAYLEFNKDKVSFEDKGEGLAVSYLNNPQAKDDSDRKKMGKPQMDARAKSGELLSEFYSYAGQMGSSSDVNAGFTAMLCKILRALSVGEVYKTKTPPSFKSFMAGIYTNYSTDVFAGVDLGTMGKKVSGDFKKGMENAVKEMPSKKA